MNKLRKCSVLLLVFTLLLSVAVPAMASTGSITVENPLEGQTYTAYLIFDVAYNEDGSAYAYSIPESSDWLAIVQSYAGISLEKAADESNGIRYVVTALESFSAADFAEHLKAGLDEESMSGTDLTVANGKASATGLPLGYYFVKSANGALCNLTTTNPSATIYDKNDIPFDKVDDQQSVEVGQTVHYEITGKVPSTTGFESYVYKVADTMSDGLTFQNDMKVYVGGAELAAEFYDYALNDSGSGFTLSIHVMDLQDYVTQPIKVAYSAVVNENAIASVEKNAATLEFSNDPTKDTTTTTKPDEETVYSAKIVIDKFALSGGEKISLAGAKFVLADKDGKFYKYTAPVADDPSTEADETVAAKVEWVDDQDNATEIETDENGAAEFVGLSDGTYHLIETAAPDGYNLLTEAKEIVIQGSDTDEQKLVITASVENMFGTELPETGGIGTTLFYVAGGALVAGAFIVLITRRHMRTEK